MFHTLESQQVETKPYPHDYSSKQIRHPVVQYGCHPPGAHSCRKSLKANTCSTKRAPPHNRFPREDLDVWRGVDALCFAVRRRCFRGKERPNGESKGELLFEVWERRW